MNDTANAFLIGAFLATLICGLVYLFIGTSPEYRDAKIKCELKLPRNQFCEMVFIPKEMVE